MKQYGKQVYDAVLAKTPLNQICKQIGACK